MHPSPLAPLPRPALRLCLTKARLALPLRHTQARLRWRRLFASPLALLAVCATPAAAWAAGGDGLVEADLSIYDLVDHPLFLAIVVSLVALFVVLVTFRAQVRDLVGRQIRRVIEQESRLLEVTTAISQELKLQPLLHLIMDTVTEILDADRSTLFLHDRRTGELWSNVAQGLESKEIRIPSDVGIAGSVFTTGVTMNIPDVYKDDRFNPEIDRKTGYRTRNMLCMRVQTKEGVGVGVIQVLNKREGPFDETDEKRIAAFTAQAAIALENARLFEEVVRMRNYSEAILESMSSGVITFGADGVLAKANGAARRLFRLDKDDDSTLVGQPAASFFRAHNAWIADSVARVLAEGKTDTAMDVVLWLREEDDDGKTLEDDDRRRRSASVNLSILPLTDTEDSRLGGILMLDDISQEKRLRSTMARYMPKEVADKLLEEGEDALGGTLQKATILFSDIRAFTTFSERSGPQETVRMLNEYFTIMADLIMSNEGILDKYIGDAIMAVFGAPFPGASDADNAVRTGIEMLQALRMYNIGREALGTVPVNIGIGISTDEVLSGNIGSSRRMDYTVIGDGVNLAARLESANKAYQTRLLVSEFTRAALTQPMQMREVDRIRVQGKNEPVAVYEPLDAHDLEDFPYMAEVFEHTSAGIALYRDQAWGDALAVFERALAAGDDGVARIYANRCRHFTEAPPPRDWDGVWHMADK